MKRVGLLAVILLVSLAAKGDPPVQLLFVPHYLTDDTPLVFSVRIQPNPENRQWRVDAIDETGESIRSSEGDLPDVITRQITWGTFGPGDYELVARVFGSEKMLGLARSHVTVIGPEP